MPILRAKTTQESSQGVLHPYTGGHCVSDLAEKRAEQETSMSLGTDLSQHKCARCGKKVTPPLIYRAGFFWHRPCWQEGSRLLANAERIARAVNPALLVHARRIPQ